MPLISRLFIKSGIVFMIASLLVAMAVALPESLHPFEGVSALRMTHFHLFVVGWITQIIFGVALWFFPKYSRERPRGPEWLGWGSFFSLNAGLVLRAVTETAFAAGASAAGWSWAMSAAAALQFAAAVLFAFAIWPRAKGR